MRPYLFYIILLVLTSSSIATPVIIDGYCYLENVYEYSGSKILFEAFSPTAETDSTFTDSSGYFQISLNPGIYNISYSHLNYQTYEVPNPTGLIVDTTLAPVTLEYGQIIEVSGGLSGIWTNDYVYHVIGDISVISGDTLFIQPGTLIKFMGYFEIVIDGDYTCLIAEGTDDTPITFTSGIDQSPDAWKRLEPSYGGSLYLSFVKIKYADWGVFPFFANNVIITNSIFNHCNNPIYIWQSWQTSNYQLFNNVIDGNVIINRNSSTKIINNIISVEYFVFLQQENDDSCKIFNNIFLNPIEFSDDGFSTGGVLIENNIFSSGLLVSPNLNLPLIGVVNSINSNGDSCDLYYNLLMDPDLVNPIHIGDYTWSMDENNDITFYLGEFDLNSQVPYIYFSNDGGSTKEHQQMQDMGGYFQTVINLYFFGNDNPPLNWFGFDLFGSIYYQQQVDFVNNPLGPEIDLGNLSDVFDYHLRSFSPAIDAGKELEFYNDPESGDSAGIARYPSHGTIINDIGIYGGPNSFFFEPIPVADFKIDTHIVIQGESINLINLSQGNPDFYYWSFPGGYPEFSNEESPAVIYDSTGFYNMTLTVENLYGSSVLTRKYLLFVKLTSSTKDVFRNELHTSIYPNPASNTVTIKSFLAQPETVIIRLYNSVGSLIENKIFYNQQKGDFITHWDMKDYSSGIYYYKFVAGSKIAFGKIILVK